MEKIQKQILNIIQRNFPVEAAPYQIVAEQIGVTQEKIIANVIQLKQAGIIRRIGANFNPAALGYTSTLIGAKVPAEKVDDFVAAVNSLPGVSHNYGREHEFNIWFTLTMADEDSINQTIAQLKQDFNLTTIFSLPAKKLFKIRVDFDLDEDNGDASVKSNYPGQKQEQEQNQEQLNLSDKQIALVRQLQGDLPITAEPFELISNKIGIAQTEILQQIKQWKAAGVIRRFGAGIRHQLTGFSTNAMVVFSLPEERIDAAGKLLANYQQVSHCYQRPSAPGWPYNLFAMTHCRNPQQLQNLVQQMVRQIEPEQYDVLLSTTEYKKTNVKFFI
ncbi:MAG: hypothetical protein JXD22_12985 [Sedimentisphaerales bacterium]|nr:hypothetical protein [Sedimentisphaerales bacterium]